MRCSCTRATHPHAVALHKQPSTLSNRHPNQLNCVSVHLVYHDTVATMNCIFSRVDDFAFRWLHLVPTFILFLIIPINLSHLTTCQCSIIHAVNLMTCVETSHHVNTGSNFLVHLTTSHQLQR